MYVDFSKLNVEQFLELRDSYIENWKKENPWDFSVSEIYGGCDIGDEFKIDIMFVRPNLRSSEWEESKDGLGISNATIEVEKKNGDFVIVDGHHRYFSYLMNNKKEIKIKIVNNSITTR